MKFDQAFYGSATIGDRGQIVIPADARGDLGLNPGDKILIMKHPVHEGLVLFKIEAVREFLDEFAAQVERLEKNPGRNEPAVPLSSVSGQPENNMENTEK